jgi:hypothetical protein
MYCNMQFNIGTQDSYNKAICKKPTSASASHTTSVAAPEKFKTWHSMAVSLRFVDRANTDQEITDPAADQLKCWICY